MLQIIAGEKGKGKTKIMIDKANAEVLTSKGSIVYIDKSNRHMYELGNKIRLINSTDYFIEDSREFAGFLSGLISQNHDVATIYLDSFLSVASAELSDLPELLGKLERLSGAFDVNFVLCISAPVADLPEAAKPYLSAAL